MSVYLLGRLSTMVEWVEPQVLGSRFVRGNSLRLRQLPAANLILLSGVCLGSDSILLRDHGSSDDLLQDDAIDVIPIAFVNDFFGTGGYPILNLANVRASAQSRRDAVILMRTHLDLQHYQCRVLQWHQSSQLFFSRVGH